MKRETAVAGQFYPGTERDLRRDVEKYLQKEADKEHAFGVVSPHAGYIFSGKIAGAVFARVNVTGTVVVLSPNHTGRGRQFALWAHGSWETPLGEVKVDEAFSEALIAKSKLVEEDTAAHMREHSLEVQLPFLQVVRPDVKIVPLTVSCDSVTKLGLLGLDIAATMRDLYPKGDYPLIVASSDMTHFENHEHAKHKDQKAIDAILALDAVRLFEEVHKHQITMCGYGPTVAMLCAAKELGATEAELVEYSHSGYVTGDYSSVVGYAGLIVK